MARPTIQKTRDDGFEPRLVGEAIKRLREAQGLSQTQLAKSAGVAKQGMSSIERGTVVPAITTLHLIARELNIDVLDLISFGLKSSTRSQAPWFGEIQALLSDMPESQRELSFNLLKAVKAQNR